MTEEQAQDTNSASALAMIAFEKAVRAEQKIDSHEEKCSERYRGIQDIHKQLNEILKDSNTRNESYKNSMRQEFDIKITGVYKRLWSMALLIISALATVLWFSIQKLVTTLLEYMTQVGVTP